MANIRDVAHLAGVSVSSVSNVLNGRSNQMRPETRLRIEQAMRELNYQPNRVAQQLKTGHARMIGLLVPSIVNPSFSALAREVDLAAKEHRYRVLLGNTYRQEDEERTFIEICSPMGCAALSLRRVISVRPILHRLPKWE